MLLTGDAISDFKRRIVRACKTPDLIKGRRQQLQAQINRYVDAIGGGLMSRQSRLAWTSLSRPWQSSQPTAR